MSVRRLERPRGLRSIKNRLALLFFSITFAALAVVYVYVTPSLGTSLRTQKLRALADRGPGLLAAAGGLGRAGQPTGGA